MSKQINLNSQNNLPKNSAPVDIFKLLELLQIYDENSKSIKNEALTISQLFIKKNISLLLEQLNENYRRDNQLLVQQLVSYINTHDIDWLKTLRPFFSETLEIQNWNKLIELCEEALIEQAKNDLRYWNNEVLSFVEKEFDKEIIKFSNRHFLNKNIKIDNQWETIKRENMLQAKKAISAQRESIDTLIANPAEKCTEMNVQFHTKATEAILEACRLNVIHHTSAKPTDKRNVVTFFKNIFQSLKNKFVKVKSAKHIASLQRVSSSPLPSQRSLNFWIQASSHEVSKNDKTLPLFPGLSREMIICEIGELVIRWHKNTIDYTTLIQEGIKLTNQAKAIAPSVKTVKELHSAHARIYTDKMRDDEVNRVLSKSDQKLFLAGNALYQTLLSDEGKNPNKKEIITDLNKALEENNYPKVSPTLTYYCKFFQPERVSKWRVISGSVEHTIFDPETFSSTVCLSKS